MAFLRKVLHRLAGQANGPAPAVAPPASDAAPAPADAERLVSEGNALEDAGRMGEALLLYREAVRIAPQLPKAHLNLGLGLAASGDPAGAEAAYRSGLALDGGHPFLNYNLAHLRYLQGDFTGARLHAERALAGRPDLVQAEVLLSNTLDELGEPAAALAAIDRALALAPELAGAQRNRARLLVDLLRVDEAVASAQAGLQAAPDDAELHWTLAIAHLLRGDFAAGWREHEWRGRVAGNDPLPDFGRRPWWGDEDLQGRSILVFSEQGLGDTLQFLRFVPQLAQRAGRVVLAVQGALTALARAAAPANCVVVGEGEALPPTDFQVPLLSLALALRVDASQLAPTMPYLRADAQRTTAWRDRLQQGGEPFQVGLVWSGNPAHRNDRNRSIPLATLAPLAGVPGCGFVSLQPAVRESDASAFAHWPGLRPYGAQLRDFAETAALVTALDLVITVDTSVAHVAGALGRPVWLLLPRVPDWRWLLQREDSPWYPSARLWRQQQPRGWDEVVDRVKAALEQKAAGRTV